MSWSLLLHKGVKERSTKEWNGEHWALRFEILEQNSRIFFGWDGSGNVPYHTFKWEPDFCHFCCLMTWSRLIDNWEKCTLCKKSHLHIPSYALWRNLFPGSQEYTIVNWEENLFSSFLTLAVPYSLWLPNFSQGMVTKLEMNIN